MGVAQKPRSWPRWVNFTPALVGHFYIGGDTFEKILKEVMLQRRKEDLELYKLFANDTAFYTSYAQNVQRMVGF